MRFPRLNLQFSLQDGHWVCEQQQGWRVSIEQFAAHLGPKTGFLVLERTLSSGKIEKKALIPVWGAETAEKQALNFPFAFDFEAEKVRTGHYVECLIDGDSLVPSSLEARYHLGRIYLEKGFQKEAEELLFASSAEPTSKPMTHKERAVLESIALSSPSGNKSARALATRLHALYLLDRDWDVFKKDEIAKTEQERTRLESKLAQAVDDREIEAAQKQLDALEPKIKDETVESREAKVELMGDYLGVLGKAKLLDKHEELLILKHLLTFSSNRMFKRRQIELTAPESLADLPKEAIQPGKPVKRPHAEHKQILAPKRSLGTRFTYWRARLANTFPFDYADPRLSEENFKKYYRCIERECKDAQKLESVRKSGLLPMLHHLALFSSGDIKTGAQSLLHELYDCTGIASKIVSTSVTAQEVRAPLPKKEKIDTTTLIKKGVQSLHSLANTAASNAEKDFLSNLGSGYFVGEDKERAKTKGNLFAANSIEAAGDAMTQKVFQDKREDIAIAETPKDKVYRLQSDKELD
ncbi:MAG: hypothetical protein JSR46_12525, partial [Verrucomicrobia bacterium]|nr:hypothetical protein [Verrucomicrobiota bacterium]